MKKSKNITIIRMLCLAAVIVPAVLIGSRILLYGMENKALAEISKITSQYAVRAPAVSNGQMKTFDMEEFIDLDGLKLLNADTRGYIKVTGTQISYPVMQSDTPHKYLKKNFYGETSVYGSIYLDNAGYPGGTNMVLYGHNMKSGKMFGELKRYLDIGFAREHREIRFITGDEIRIYDVCAVFRSPADQEELVQNLIPYTETEYNQLLKLIRAQGGIVLEEFSWGDQLITLATCEYSKRNGRLFVIGRLTDTIYRKERT